MKPKKHLQPKKALLKFDRDFANLESLRADISTCLRTGDNLWLSYDEDAGIERLTRRPGKRKFGHHEHHPLSEYFELPDQSELDLEALAYEAPYLWFSGSMSLKRGKPDPDDETDAQFAALAEIKQDLNRFNLGRIPCLERDGEFRLYREVEHEGRTLRAALLRGGNASNELRNALLNDEHLGPFMTMPSKDNGFDIEGLAVHGGRLFLGLRGPVLNGHAVIVEIACDERDGELLMRPFEGEPRLYRKHFVDLQGRGIRELNTAAKGDLYLLAGPTMDLDGTVSVCRIPGGLADRTASVERNVQWLFDTASGGGGPGLDKAEGMAFLGGGEMLIVYDAPSPKRLKGKRSVVMDVYPLK
ncbi:MAG: DUF3616 domain-containing protein [Verrucomicrobiota bacterium]